MSLDSVNKLKLMVLASALSGVVACGRMEARLASTASMRSEVLVMQDSAPTVSEGSVSYESVDAQESEQVASVEGPKQTSPRATDMEGPGVLKPTVYYFPVINEDTKGCPLPTKQPLHGAGGKILGHVCKETAEACGLQGSCAIVQNGQMKTYNIIGRFEGQDRFFEIEKEGCRFGYGVQSSCLDPFFTLAADLNIYKPGEVIFVPAVVGLVLPDGTVHDGYFIIRDQGRGIVGRGRFDFYSGYYSWLDQKNPFNKLGLGDVKTNIPYFRVRGETAKKILAARSYPKLPAKVFGGYIVTK